ncbi:GCN5-related N-acetyltransferase [uncultured Eubacteriales bacterium]|uniref:GCN5-related N-acetyltransferase n=1 Tax=uncultured Eubacteriales bacterium TaxID=172733 RepID=A0A212JUK4_9FIRM|nr:GCN5-related N-acetyltransferase [uncultured Eubacteriales bacterium]
MTFETPRLLLRPFQQGDLDDLFEYGSQPGVGRMAGWRPYATIGDARHALEKNRSNPNIFALVYRKTGKVVGHIAIHEDSENGRDDTKELGFALNESYQRRGLMSEAVSLVLEHLSSIGVRKVWACCFQENLPSKRLIEKCGFAFMQEGTYYSPSLNQTFLSFEYVYTF